MLMNKSKAEENIKKERGIAMKRKFVFAICFLAFALVGTACRYDMQDQPRYKAYKSSDFFSDDKSMRDLPEGTVSRGNLQENKAFYTGKKENADPNAQVESTTDPVTGNTLVSSFPNDVEEFPIPVTEELLNRGEQRYEIFCGVCHGTTGKGDGMIVRRGYPAPPTYHDDRLRNAPVGHYFDVITNGWGKMNSYSSMIPVTDRWAIVAYIRALQISQNPDMKMDKSSADSADDANNNESDSKEDSAENKNEEPKEAEKTDSNTNTNGGAN